MLPIYADYNIFKFKITYIENYNVHGSRFIDYHHSHSDNMDYSQSYLSKNFQSHQSTKTDFYQSNNLSCGSVEKEFADVVLSAFSTQENALENK